MPVIKQKKGHYITVLPYGTKVKFKDIFNLKQFYIALHHWLDEYGWEAHKLVNGKVKLDGERYEIYYREKITGGGAKEMDILWRMWRPAPNSNWLRQHMDFKFKVLGTTATEVIRDGQKFKAHKGEVSIEVNAGIEKLYIPAFEQHPILKPFLQIFDKRVYEIQEKEKELYQEVYVLMNFIKQWFKLKRYLPYEESKSFFPSQAWPSHHREDSHK
ncbi:hypothetical protein CL619_03530 [archaeon]|nr:hypothetical protein [archaeon]|tara:strand:+ start:1435 stop:2079 length:645 start_codon:yes stop_codon:yes gene_type:complete